MGAVEEVLPEFLFRDQIRRLVAVVRQFADRAGVRLLGPG